VKRRQGSARGDAVSVSAARVVWGKRTATIAMHPITIENDAISLEVWPQFGGKVSSVVDKADNFDLLFSYPTEFPPGPQYDSAYNKTWYAGWDECFPAIIPCKYLRHPYEGIAVPDHGELWGLPTTAVPTKNGITTVWHGLRFGYRLTRKLYLDGPTVNAEYTLVNLAPFDFFFVWAQHPIMSVAQRARILLGAGASRAFRFSHAGPANPVDQPFEWPMLEGGLDMSNPASLPDGATWKLYSESPIEQPLTVSYPERGRSLHIEFTSESNIAAYWGIWINSGGWGGHRHFAIEATTGRFDQIDRAMRDGSAGQVGPMGRVDWNTRWSLAAGA
jgi:hypothetical protein